MLTHPWSVAPTLLWTVGMVWKRQLREARHVRGNRHERS
jgi:hypothetical protein